MTQEAQLKACPFCGGEATIWKAFPQANYPWATGVEHTDSCPDAGWEGLCHKTKEEAIAAWNTRIESGVVAELVAVVRDTRLFNEGVGFYNFSRLPDDERANASYDAWQQIAERMDAILAKLETSK